MAVTIINICNMSLDRLFLGNNANKNADCGSASETDFYDA
jgi:hypothetical protein